MSKNIVSILASAFLFVTGAKAETYNFFSITNNNAGNSAAGAAQLIMEVTDLGTQDAQGRNQVLFKFINAGPSSMSITDIYFDDGTLLAISALQESPGVNFEVGASPKNLPGGSAYNFQPERSGFSNKFFSLDSESPTQPMGVNPGEWLGVVYSLQGTQTFASVIAALALSQTNIQNDIVGGLRVGIHVQGFGNGGSESFINGPAQGSGSPSPVPDSPSTFVLLGLAVLGLGYGRRCLA
jgi:hypothetical protein